MKVNTFSLSNYSNKTQMNKDNKMLERQGEQALLSSLTYEVDNIFFSLRKADQIIRRELKLLDQQTFKPFKKSLISPINKERLKKIVDKMPIQQLLVDEYIVYMLKNEKNSIFTLIEEYNNHLEKRSLEQYDKIMLQGIDEKLVYYIRHLGAMIYHLNIHLNLINVLLKNAWQGINSQQTATKESEQVVMEYMVKEWGRQQRDVKFIEITIDEPYAIVSWSLEDLRGDAILLQEEGYWQLMNISAGRFGLEDFENADVPLEIAQRMLNLHHQKLGY